MERDLVRTPAFVAALAGLGPGALREGALKAHIFPLFSRVLARGEIYLANHSLGRPPDVMADAVGEALDAWYADLDGAWEPWLAERERFRALTARLVGAARPDTIIPKTSCAQALRAVLGALPPRVDGRPHHVLTTAGEFDSAWHVFQVWAHRGLIRLTVVDGAPSDERTTLPGTFDVGDLCDALSDDIDLVYVSAVFFATGQVLEGVDELVAEAHERGALVMLDLYHAAGVLPVDLAALGPDFATGGSYKYTRGGPGACWLYVHPGHLTDAPATPPADGLFPVDTGWFAKAAPFSYARTPAPVLAAGGDGWLESTPPILAWYQANPGLELTLGLGVARLRTYNLDQQAHLVAALEEEGVDVRRFHPHGAYVLVPVDDLGHAVGALKAEGVNVDGRPCPVTGQAYVRLCPDVLTTTDELDEAAARVGAVLR